MITTNFHTHTVFCDGRDTPRELVEAALEKGMTALGFSGHSYLEPDKDCSMTQERQLEYIRQISELKAEYRGAIELYCGIEQDILSEKPSFDYDYIIGSVHTLYKNGKYISFDLSPEITEDIVRRYYGGDFDALAEEYFDIVSGVVDKTGADIIGHLDLVSKYSEINDYRESDRYLRAAEAAVRALARSGKPFEINTGAMVKGTKSIPCPSPAILKMIKENGGRIVFSSDCHDKRYLDYAFDEMAELARQIGFREHGVLTEHGIEYIPF